MYDLISQIINHEWISQYAPGDQTYIIVFSGLMIICLTIFFLDMIIGFIFKFINRGR